MFMYLEIKTNARKVVAGSMLPVGILLAGATSLATEPAHDHGKKSYPENGDFSTLHGTGTAVIELRNPKFAKKLGGKYQKTELPKLKNCKFVTFSMPAKIFLDEDIKVSAPRSVRIDCRKGESMDLVLSMPAKPMKVYKLSLWVKSSDPLASVSLVIWSNKKKCGATAFKNLSDAKKKNGFSLVEYIFSSKEKASALYIYLVGANTKTDKTVSIWFDDVKVQEINET
jgi:hypothetical protein